MGLTDDQRGVLDLVAGQAMQADLEFLRRFGSSMADKSDEPRVVAFATASYPFLALLVHEMDKQFGRVSGVDGTTFLDSDAAEVIRRARHSLKFFDDSNLGFDGYLALFAKTLADDDGDQDASTWCSSMDASSVQL